MNNICKSNSKWIDLYLQTTWFVGGYVYCVLLASSNKFNIVIQSSTETQAL